MKPAGEPDEMVRPLEEKQTGTALSDKLICERISEAHISFGIWGEALCMDHHITRLSNSLKGMIAASGKALQDSGISMACRTCKEEDGENCCGAGIENKYTTQLLLLNLLFGEPFLEKRLYSDGCFFLSERGCRLTLRHVLCVNYLCLKLQRMLPPWELARLQQITGEEMETGFILNEAVKRFMGR
jgi:hypothetical protein